MSRQMWPCEQVHPSTVEHGGHQLPVDGEEMGREGTRRMDGGGKESKE